MNSRRPIDAYAFLVMTVLCAIWGSQQVAIKLVATDMSSLLQVGIRSGIAAIAIAALVLIRGEYAALHRSTWGPGLLIGALFGLEFVFIGEGLRFTNASHMAIFLYTSPIFTAIGLHVMRADERLEPIQWLGIAVAFGGVILSFTGRAGEATSSVVWFGDLFGIAAAISLAATTVAVRSSNLSEAPASVILLYQLAGGFLLPCIGALLLGQTSIQFTPALVASLGYQSLVVAAISYLAWFVLLRTYLASRLGVLTFMTPVFGVMAGITVLGERLETGLILGALFIMAGILLVSARDVLLKQRFRKREVEGCRKAVHPLLESDAPNA